MIIIAVNHVCNIAWSPKDNIDMPVPQYRDPTVLLVHVHVYNLLTIIHCSVEVDILLTEFFCLEKFAWI